MYESILQAIKENRRVTLNNEEAVHLAQQIHLAILQPAHLTPVPDFSTLDEH